MADHERIDDELNSEGLIVRARCSCGWESSGMHGHGMRDSEWRNHLYDETGRQQQ